MMAQTLMSGLALSVCSFLCLWLWCETEKEANKTDRPMLVDDVFVAFPRLETVGWWKKGKVAVFTTRGLFVAFLVLLWFHRTIFVVFFTRLEIANWLNSCDFSRGQMATLTVGVFACWFQSKKETNKQKEAPTCCDFDFD